jgi:hypothetical protein
MENQTVKKPSWEEKRVQLIDTLKKPSEAQQLFSLLYKKANKTDDDIKKLAILIKAEKARERAMNANAAISKLMSSEKDAERKARNTRLIKQGYLFDLAGLQTRSEAELLGALLTIASSAQSHPDRWATWKSLGETAYADKQKKAA